MDRMTLDQAYPGLAFRPKSRNWWARLTRVPAECVHLEIPLDWMATLVPDTLYLGGKARVQRRPARPEVSLCQQCCLSVLEPELAAFGGRAVAFEPLGELLSQYFFVGREDFAAAGLKPEVGEAIARRLEERSADCERCRRPASWLWFSRREVSSLDDVPMIAAAPGLRLCARHGAAELCASLAALPEANLFYVNVPYGDAGAYLWI
jgi:hypothetical protein